MACRGVVSRVADSGQLLESRSARFAFRVRAVGRLHVKPALPRAFRQYLFLSVDVKDQLTGRPHTRSRTKIEFFVTESPNRPERHTMHHVEIVQLRQQPLLLVHISFPHDFDSSSAEGP